MLFLLPLTSFIWTSQYIFDISLLHYTNRIEVTKKVFPKQSSFLVISFLQRLMTSMLLSLVKNSSDSQLPTFSLSLIQYWLKFVFFETVLEEQGWIYDKQHGGTKKQLTDFYIALYQLTPLPKQTNKQWSRSFNSVHSDHCSVPGKAIENNKNKQHYIFKTYFLTLM